MTPEETCQMIDTIYDGREYEYIVNGDGASVVFDKDGATFYAEEFKGSFDLESPRQAREIAAALVAWADHKEGSDNGVAASKFLLEIAHVCAAHPEV